MTPGEVVGSHVRGAGWVEVICGPMFSGKTEELIRRLRRAQIARQRVQVFKPEVDDRYSRTDVVSHNDRREQAVAVRSAGEILLAAEPDTAVVGIDEAQFFDKGLLRVVDRLATRGLRVVVAGLDTDYRSEPFGPMPSLMAVAEYVTKLMAVCVHCGNPANRTLRIRGGGKQVEVGAAERYVALCRLCYVIERASGEGAYGDAVVSESAELSDVSVEGSALTPTG